MSLWPLDEREAEGLLSSTSGPMGGGVGLKSSWRLRVWGLSGKELHQDMS